MKTLNALLLVAIATLSAASFGQDKQSINTRLKNQNARINQGVRTGELTRNEARVVRTDDRLIHREEHLDRTTDKGHLTKSERNSLQKQLNNNSKRIYRLKHNDVERH